MKIGRLVLRGLIGGLFIGHGTQKLFGSFGGPGLQGTQAFMESLNLRPARRNALAAGITETTGGTLVALGLATPLAAAGLTGVMITAIRTVHLRNGVWVANGGYEYNAVLIAALLALADDGPGDLSLDRAFGLERSGPGWAIAALALGAAASTATIELGRRASAAVGSGSPTPPEVAGDPTTSDS